MKYGVPYRGSKNAIAEWVVEHLPASDTFVDLFAGGCAVTHAAMLSGKFERFVANDISDAPDVFRDAINGEFEGYATVPTRDEFNASDDDALRLMYSFGNNRTDYLWSRQLEPVKVSASRMVLGGSVHERRTAYREFIRELGNFLENDCVSPDKVKNLQMLEAVSRLERITSIPVGIRGGGGHKPPRLPGCRHP